MRPTPRRRQSRRLRLPDGTDGIAGSDEAICEIRVVLCVRDSDAPRRPQPSAHNARKFMRQPANRFTSGGRRKLGGRLTPISGAFQAPVARLRLARQIRKGTTCRGDLRSTRWQPTTTTVGATPGHRQPLHPRPCRSVIQTAAPPPRRSAPIAHVCNGMPPRSCEEDTLEPLREIRRIRVNP